MPLAVMQQTLASSVSGLSVDSEAVTSKTRRCRMKREHYPPPILRNRPSVSDVVAIAAETPASSSQNSSGQGIDSLYLFACHVEWERSEEPNAAWELLSAAESVDSDTRAQARSLLSNSRHLGGIGFGASSELNPSRNRHESQEMDMKAPYGLDIIDDCGECRNTRPSYFCGFSSSVLNALSAVSHRSTLPAGAIVFVEGQVPRGMFIVCSGSVTLSTTSREGKILILKTANAGDALGLSATVSGTGYETTAETASPCQLTFVDRKHYLELMDAHSEIGVHAAQCLSRDFRSAHRDIHDLVLTRSSAGKLARLLLAHSPAELCDRSGHIRCSMTHEEMGQRIGASRETVTRLLSHLRKKQLIRLDGSNLVIRDRTGLEALAV
jgi:CRP/FNR family transcriptional regulator